MLTAARRRSMGFPLPASGTVNVVPTYGGPGVIMHPSVVDMGARWNGYRWWRADTPMPEEWENPSIYGSNDRINWTVPAGLTNPIDPWPGAATGNLKWFNSDTELVWDPVGQRLVVYWREVGGPLGTMYWAASSRDGVTWVHHGVRLIPQGIPNLSMGLARDEATGQWRALMFGAEGAIYTAPDVLGPWTLSAPLTGWLSEANNPGLAYHGDMIQHDGLWWCIAQVRYLGVLCAISEDGYHWYWGSNSLIGAYRPTMAPSTLPGFMDVWTSQETRYHRLPVSEWLDLLP